ncbi:MAG: GCV T protein [Magnetococcales bacterium]|nr:GCV T protein [Magnetococcales bacterium]HIJ84019.1 folate-binding protein YgfZ [Magnetococcales bacterium]
MSLLEPLLKTSVPWAQDRGKNSPLHFGDPEAEKNMLLEHVALVDFSHRGTITIAGDERVSFLGGLVTNQVKDLQPGRCIYTAMLSPQGRFLWDFTLVDHGQALALDTEPNQAEDLSTALNFYRLRSKVTIQDLSLEFGTLGLVGPGAPAALARIFSSLDVAASPLGTTWLPEEGLRLWRDPRHPDFGFRIQVPAPGFVNLWQRLLSSVPAAGFSAWEAYRILRGLPRGGAEWTAGETLPLEAGALEMNAISFQKGCYVGQETTARTHHRGTLKKRLFHVTVASREVVPSHTPVLLPSGKEVGVVTSSVLHEGKIHGLALLRLSDVAADAPMTVLGWAVSVKRPQWAAWE